MWHLSQLGSTIGNSETTLVWNNWLTCFERKHLAKSRWIQQDSTIQSSYTLRHPNTSWEGIWTLQTYLKHRTSGGYLDTWGIFLIQKPILFVFVWFDFLALLYFWSRYSRWPRRRVACHRMTWRTGFVESLRVGFSIWHLWVQCPPKNIWAQKPKKTLEIYGFKLICLKVVLYVVFVGLLSLWNPLFRF